MPKLTQQTEFVGPVELISTYPKGITVDALMQLEGITLQRRSLQRRLAITGVFLDGAHSLSSTV